jgi:hypothetical protein
VSQDDGDPFASLKDESLIPELLAFLDRRAAHERRCFRSTGLRDRLAAHLIRGFPYLA